jgi:hypothetical protein
MKADRLLPALVACGVLSAVLYSALMPLWEGFDEPFYAYVDWLSRHRGMPRLGRMPLSAEVAESLRLAPASHVVRQNLPFVMTFSEYFALPEAERAARRAQLEALSPALRHTDAPDTSSYEAQQAPLAYLLLALPNRLWGDVPLPERVLRLRLVCALAACLLQAALTLALAKTLRLPETARYVALWLVLASQVFYASIARVSNDWLAIPLATAFFLCLLRFYQQPRVASAFWLGGALAAGLLTKAYFLAFLPIALAVVVWRRASAQVALAAAGVPLVIAGPWYARNVLLYGNLSGMLQATAGVSFRDTFAAALSISWPRALLSFARDALWLGNSSFTTFSAATLHLILILMLAAALLWLKSAWRKPGTAPEWLSAAGCLIFVAAVLYAAAVFFAYTQGPVISTAPWHAQAIAAPVACLLCLGLSRSAAVGRWLTAALVVLFAYMLAATYVVKLIPMYAGYPEGKMRLARLAQWYWSGDRLLGATALGHPAVIWCLTAAVVALAVVVCVTLCRGGRACPTPTIPAPPDRGGGSRWRR